MFVCVCVCVHSYVCPQNLFIEVSQETHLINTLCTLWYVYVTYYALHVYEEFHHIALLSKYLAKRSG